MGRPPDPPFSQDLPGVLNLLEAAVPGLSVGILGLLLQGGEAPAAGKDVTLRLVHLLLLPHGGEVGHGPGAPEPLAGALHLHLDVHGPEHDPAPTGAGVSPGLSLSRQVLELLAECSPQGRLARADQTLVPASLLEIYDEVRLLLVVTVLLSALGLPAPEEPSDPPNQAGQDYGGTKEAAESDHGSDP